MLTTGTEPCSHTSLDAEAGACLSCGHVFPRAEAAPPTPCDHAFTFGECIRCGAPGDAVVPKMTTCFCGLLAVEACTRCPAKLCANHGREHKHGAEDCWLLYGPGPLQVKVVRPGLPFDVVPRYQTTGAAGLDLVAALAHRVVVPISARLIVATGVALAIPVGWEGQVRPRSGLAKAHGFVAVLGTIDSDYRGEVMVNLINHGPESFTVEPGMRVAQLVIAPAPQVELVVVDELPATERGAAGFGSTGK